uniref:Uncharacterized protein n=1 Tax=Picea sitchensis TaxID=3332 RepID=A0A6B9XSD0_PICSI|nr:hypothetical protein Q903MT_gene6947 [Picea sitchensis]
MCIPLCTHSLYSPCKLSYIIQSHLTTFTGHFCCCVLLQYGWNVFGIIYLSDYCFQAS